MPHAIDEDLGAAAGMLSSPASISRRDHLGRRQARTSREMWTTSGGESACRLNAGYRALTARNRSSYHSSGNVGVVPALQQDLPAADRNRLLDLPEDLLERQHVAVARSHGPVERAEVAARHADVRVVDVAVDDVGDDAVGVLARTDAVCQPSKHMRRRLRVQGERLVAREPLASRDTIRQPRKRRHRLHSNARVLAGSASGSAVGAPGST